MSHVAHLSCSRCGRRYDHHGLHGLCGCGGPLLVEYDLERLRDEASKRAIASREPTMWRYLEFLPVVDQGRIVSLGEGFTPLAPCPALGRRLGLPGLLLKDEGANPTGTFKARGGAMGMTAAAQRGVAEVALATAGSAGAAWAAYGRAAGIGVHVAMPADAPEANRRDCLAAGADLELVPGMIADAGRTIAEAVRANGWFDVSTLREPYRIEGKKTLGLEIAEQLGFELPDAVICPTGGGVGVIGMRRAFEQLARIGWVEGRVPRLFAVQSEGCAPIVRAFERGEEKSEPWPDPRTVAQGLRVPKALGDFLVLRAIRETHGGAVAVSDAEIAEAQRALEAEAIRTCPEGAAALAGARRLRERGHIGPEDRVVLINTGATG